jgi:hypothetical protein
MRRAMLAGALAIEAASSAPRMLSGRKANGWEKRNGDASARCWFDRWPRATAVSSTPYLSSGPSEAVTASRRYVASAWMSKEPRRCPSSMGSARVTGSSRMYFRADRACARSSGRRLVTPRASMKCSSARMRRRTSSSQNTRRSTQLPRDQSWPNTNSVVLCSAPRFNEEGSTLPDATSFSSRRTMARVGSFLLFLAPFDLDFFFGDRSSSTDSSGRSSFMSMVKMLLCTSSLAGVSLSSWMGVLYLRIL